MNFFWVIILEIKSHLLSDIVNAIICTSNWKHIFYGNLCNLNIIKFFYFDKHFFYILTCSSFSCDIEDDEESDKDGRVERTCSKGASNNREMSSYCFMTIFMSSFDDFNFN